VAELAFIVIWLLLLIVPAAVIERPAARGFIRKLRALRNTKEN
jgi:hypothetical protein